MNNAGRAGGYDGGVIDIDALWDEFYERVYHWLYNMVGNAEDARDLANCVFLRAWQRQDRYNTAQGTVCTWLYTISHNIAYSFLRRKRVWTRSLDLVVEKPGPSSDEPVARHETAAAKEAVWRAVDELPEMESKVMSLHFHDGYALREVAQMLGVCLRTAKFHEARGIVLLREKLARR